MNPKGYCPECGKPSNIVDSLISSIGVGMWILECAKCGKWEIVYKK